MCVTFFSSVRAHTNIWILFIRIALENLAGKCSEARNFSAAHFTKFELKVQKKLSAFEEMLSRIMNEKGELITVESIQSQGIKSLYEAKENRALQLNDRLQALTTDINSEYYGNRLE